MPTHVTFRWREHRVTLVPGDLIGRHASCAFHLPDPRVSEAHAMVAVRRGELVLLNLRGGIVNGGRRVKDPRLVIGDRLALATDVEILVEEVQLPDWLWFVDTPSGAHPIDPVVSLVGSPPRVVAGRHPDAHKSLWTDGEACYDGEHVLDAGDEVVLEDWRGVLRWDRRNPIQGQPTQQRRQGALTVNARFHTVAIEDAGAHVLTINGVPARILHELVEMDGPVAWEIVAREVWSDGVREVQLRRRWDAALVRLRRRLAAAGLRDLVMSDGCGHVEIVKRPGDTFVLDG